MLFRLSRLLLIIAIGAAAGASLALSASVSQGLETDVAVTTTPAPRPPTSEADVGPSAGLPTSGSGGYFGQLVESPSHLLIGLGATLIAVALALFNASRRPAPATRSRGGSRTSPGRRRPPTSPQ